MLRSFRITLMKNCYAYQLMLTLYSKNMKYSKTYMYMCIKISKHVSQLIKTHILKVSNNTIAFSFPSPPARRKYYQCGSSDRPAVAGIWTGIDWQPRTSSLQSELVAHEGYTASCGAVTRRYAWTEPRKCRRWWTLWCRWFDNKLYIGLHTKMPALNVQRWLWYNISVRTCPAAPACISAQSDIQPVVGYISPYTPMQ